MYNGIFNERNLQISYVTMHADLNACTRNCMHVCGKLLGACMQNLGACMRKRLGAKYAIVGCKVCGCWVHVYGDVWVHVCGFWVHL